MRAHFILLVLLVLATPPSGATTLDDIDFFVDNMVQGGAHDQFPAMINPTPVRPDEVSYVADYELVLGVYLDGEARAYPQNLGRVHEIINDELAGHFISVSFCPLTGSGQNLEAIAPTASRSSMECPDSCSTATW